MSHKDQYIVNNLGRFVCYYKNGKLHREAGPAVYLMTDKDKYCPLILEDKNLYQLGDIKVGSLPASIILNMGNKKEVYYYLEGISYTKKEFNAILDKKNLNKELELELSKNNKKKNHGIKI